MNDILDVLEQDDVPEPLDVIIQPPSNVQFEYGGHRSNESKY